MIKRIKIKFLKFFYLIFLRINFKKKHFNNYGDLNFKQKNFVNFNLIKHYLFKENFIFNTRIIDIHTFNFLIYYQKMGGKKGIDLSKKNIFLWYEKFKNYFEFPWSSDLTAKRYINIIYNYDFICSILVKNEIEKINQIIYFHEKRFLFDLSRKQKENISTYEIIALVLIKCINKNLNNYLLIKIKDIIESQIDEIQMHKSYNILEHAKFVNNLNEVRNILLYFNINKPHKLDEQILAATSLLSKYKHDDSSLPLFNGCNNNYKKSIQEIIDQEQFLKSRDLKNFKNGIFIYKDYKKTIFFDVVQPEKNNFIKNFSAGTLAIEISAEGEKIITNCGSSESSGKNPAYLKYSAAHSTIIINNTNISEIADIELSKKSIKNVYFEFQDKEDEMFFTGTHNGYQKNLKKVCKRKLQVKKNQNLILCEDTVISSNTKFEKTIFHIRFHVMPNISLTITKNKKSVIMKTKKNNIWIFKSDKDVKIEKSIYIENDNAIETNQIVIEGVTTSIKNKIKWSIEKI